MSRLIGWAFGVVLLATTACRPAGWTPILEESSLGAIETETEEALASVRKVRSLLPSDPSAADRAAVLAEVKLERLLSYYLPLANARSYAYNAYRHFYLQDRHKAQAELDKIEQILLGMVEGAGHHLTLALKRPLELVEDARADFLGDPTEAPKALEDLAYELNSMVIKGRLIIEE